MAAGKFIANLGDKNPLSYGGYFIYEDAHTTSRPGHKRWRAQDWSPKEVRYSAVLLVPVDDAPYLVYRFELECLKLVGGFLVPMRYDPSWHHPLEKYDEWFSDSIPKMAAYAGVSEDELRKAFTSQNPHELAFAYELVGNYHGLENLDSDPLSLTQEQVEKQFKEELRRS